MSLFNLVRCLFGKHDWWPDEFFSGASFKRCSQCGRVKISKRGIV